MNSEQLLWDREYSIHKVIPSSSRRSPSKALLLFSEILDFERLPRVLDAGCGTGRNAIYFAQKGCEVYAVDYSDEALARLETAAIEAGVHERIITYNRSLSEPLPFGDDYFDLVIDSYVFCHFIDRTLQQHYRAEILRVTKSARFFYSSVFSTEDSYYAEILDRSSDPAGRIVTDPHNGLTKHLYTEDEVKKFFLTDFNLLYLTKFEFGDKVLGRFYWRNVFALVLQKPLNEASAFNAE